MKSNKLIVIFLVKFFGTYTVLFFLYSFYLSQTQITSDPYTCAPITTSVAEQTKCLLNAVGYEAEIQQHPDEVSVKLIVDGYYISRVVEGCNSISIIILFISFIVAFSNGFTRTGIYVFGGSLLIYAVNIIRIAIITVAIYKFPNYLFLLHELLFPAIIYGTTFLLWFIWVRYYSKLKE